MEYRDKVAEVSSKIFDLNLKLKCLALQNVANITIEEARKLHVEMSLVRFDLAVLNKELNELCDGPEARDSE